MSNVCLFARLAQSFHFRTVAAIVFMITHGHELADGKDHLMELAERTDDDFSESSVPGAFIVDVFPIRELKPSLFHVY